MTGVKTFPFFDQGSIFWTAETISAKLLTGEATGAHLNGALGPGVCDSKLEQKKQPVVGDSGK